MHQLTRIRCIAKTGRRWRAALAPAVIGAVALAASPAKALFINPIYDASVNSAPAGFRTAFQDAINFFDSTFSNPITVNLDVGWGEIGGYAISPGALGESGTYLAGYYSYAQVRNALIGHATSATDRAAVASLPVSDPTGGRRELMSTAEAKALGLLNYGGTDGFVGFDRTASWTFNPSNRAVSGAFDFIGTAEHEISEVLGRIADLGSISGTLFPLDLFRYSAANTRALSPGNGQYFSIDSGNTNLDMFNGVGGGDLGDWAGHTLDAFDASAAAGVMLPISNTDLTELDALGYTLGSSQASPAPSPYIGINFGIPGLETSQVPEPGGLVLLATALIGFGTFRLRHQSRRFNRAAGGRARNLR